MMDLVPCQRCNTEILPATAEAPGDYCMTCAKTWAPQVVEDMEARRNPREYKVTYVSLGFLGATLELFDFKPKGRAHSRREGD